MTATPTERDSPEESNFNSANACEAFDVDVLLRSLAHPCRREVLCHLDAEPEWSWSELAANLGTIETGVEISSQEGAEVALCHRHFPLLEEAGLVEVDRDGRRVRRGEHFDRVREMVDAAVSAL